MSKALKWKQNRKTINDVTDNSFKKVVKKVTEHPNLSKGSSTILLNSDDEEIELIPKKKSKL
jgi:hypothetical protein